MGDSWKQPFGGRTDDDDAVNPPGKGKRNLPRARARPIQRTPQGKTTTTKGDQPK